jgi:hypothetical protein
MAGPLLIAVEDDRDRLRLVRQELVNRYGRDYRVVCVSTAAEGLRLLDAAGAAGGEVALLLASLWLPGETWLDLFAQSRARHLDARCVALVTPQVDAVLAQDRVFEAAGSGLIDDWISPPWQPGDEHLHQGISNFLYQWWQAHRPSHLGGIRIVGER